MPVEISTADGRMWARPAHQNHERLPLIRLVSRAEARRRRARAVAAILIFSAAVMSAVLLLKGF